MVEQKKKKTGRRRNDYSEEVGSVEQLLLFKVSVAALCFVRTILIANNVQVMSKEVAPTFSANDVSKIKKFSRQKKVL